MTVVTCGRYTNAVITRNDFATWLHAGGTGACMGTAVVIVVFLALAVKEVITGFAFGGFANAGITALNGSDAQHGAGLTRLAVFAAVVVVVALANRVIDVISDDTGIDLARAVFAFARGPARNGFCAVYSRIATVVDIVGLFAIALRHFARRILNFG